MDEDKTAEQADKEHLNERARQQFHDEVAQTVARVNEVNPSETKLYVPDMRFNRKIGDYSGERYAVDGRKLTQAEWEAYAPTVLPSPADDAQLAEIFKNPNWIAPKGSQA